MFAHSRDNMKELGEKLQCTPVSKGVKLRLPPTTQFYSVHRATSQYVMITLNLLQYDTFINAFV